MNISGATNPTSKVEIKGPGIGGEELEDTVHVAVEVWLVWGDAETIPSLGLLHSHLPRR